MDNKKKQAEPGQRTEEQESKTNNNKTSRDKINSAVTCRVKGEAKKDEKETKPA